MRARKKTPRDGPLEQCCNGCLKPPKPPSWVLCEDCLDKLDQQMNEIAKPLGKTWR